MEIETLEEFSLRHGGSAAKGSDGDRLRVLVFADGATVLLNDRMDTISFREPPADPNSRAGLLARRRYHSLKFSVFHGAFDNLKRALTGRPPAGVPVGPGRQLMPAVFKWDEARYGPMPTETTRYGEPCGVAALNRLKDLAAPHKAEIEAIDAALAALPEVIAEREAPAAWAAAEEERRRLDEEDSARLAAVHFDDEESHERSAVPGRT